MHPFSGFVISLFLVWSCDAGNVTCSFQNNDYVESIYYNGESHPEWVPANNASTVHNLTFEEVFNASLVFTIRDYQTDAQSPTGHCKTAYLIVFCWATDPSSGWHGVDSTSPWLAIGSSSSLNGTEYETGDGSGWGTPCTSMASVAIGFPLNLIVGKIKLWADNHQYAAFKFNPAEQLPCSSGYYFVNYSSYPDYVPNSMNTPVPATAPTSPACQINLPVMSASWESCLLSPGVLTCNNPVSMCVDGHFLTSCYSASYGTGNNSWIQLDLGSPKQIGLVEIVNSGAPQYLGGGYYSGGGFEIWVGNSSSSTPADGSNYKCFSSITDVVSPTPGIYLFRAKGPFLVPCSALGQFLWIYQYPITNTMGGTFDSQIELNEITVMGCTPIAGCDPTALICTGTSDSQCLACYAGFSLVGNTCV